MIPILTYHLFQVPPFLRINLPYIKGEEWHQPQTPLTFLCSGSKEPISYAFQGLRGATLKVLTALTEKTANPMA